MSRPPFSPLTTALAYLDAFRQFHRQADAVLASVEEQLLDGAIRSVDELCEEVGDALVMLTDRYEGELAKMRRHLQLQQRTRPKPDEHESIS